MDRRGAAIRLLIAALVLALGSAALGGDRPRLQALNWTAPGHERQVLLEQPAMCLDPAAPREAAIGEALFHAPALLGGQAERAGLSCAGCHANGRRSEAFFLEGISAGPGTADITSSFFALPRANAVFDPRSIPDLAKPGKVSRAALEPFLRGLVVEEFSGAEPGPGALSALAAYVSAVRVCPDRTSEARALGHDLRLVGGAIEAAIAMRERGDGRSARVLVKAARFRLGLIHERMAGERLKPVRQRLLNASRALAPLESSGDAAALAAWRKRFEAGTARQLVRSEERSLYNPREVDRWLAKGR